MTFFFDHFLTIKNQKNYTEVTYYDLLFLACLYKYLSLQTIPTNPKVGSEAIFHKTTKLTSSQMLFGYKVFGLIPNLAKSHKKVYFKFRFCFNHSLKCSVVIWFQSNLSLNLDLPQIIIKKLPVSLHSGNLKIVKKFNTPQESIPVKNLNKMLLPTNLVKPVTLRLHWSTAYLWWKKF